VEFRHRLGQRVDGEVNRSGTRVKPMRQAEIDRVCAIFNGRAEALMIASGREEFRRGADERFSARQVNSQSNSPGNYVFRGLEFDPNGGGQKRISGKTGFVALISRHGLKLAPN
jgi:hypothetical protein